RARARPPIVPGHARADGLSRALDPRHGARAVRDAPERRADAPAGRADAPVGRADAPVGRADAPVVAAEPAAERPPGPAPARVAPVELPADVEAELARFSPRDLAIGVPTYNNAETIAGVAHAVRAGVSQTLDGVSAPIVNADAGSGDGTS